MPYEETEKSNRPTTGQRRRPRQMAFQPEEPGKNVPARQGGSGRTRGDEGRRTHRRLSLGSFAGITQNHRQMEQSNEANGMTRRRMQIRRLLEQKPRSVTELTIITGFCDPRSYIRYLRSHGVNVTDEWHSGADGSRYKVYFIPPKPQPERQ